MGNSTCVNNSSLKRARKPLIVIAMMENHDAIFWQVLSLPKCPPNWPAWHADYYPLLTCFCNPLSESGLGYVI